MGDQFDGGSRKRAAEKEQERLTSKEPRPRHVSTIERTLAKQGKAAKVEGHGAPKMDNAGAGSPSEAPAPGVAHGPSKEEASKPAAPEAPPAA